MGFGFRIFHIDAENMTALSMLPSIPLPGESTN